MAKRAVRLRQLNPRRTPRTPTPLGSRLLRKPQRKYLHNSIVPKVPRASRRSLQRLHPPLRVLPALQTLIGLSAARQVERPLSARLVARDPWARTPRRCPVTRAHAHLWELHRRAGMLAVPPRLVVRISVRANRLRYRARRALNALHPLAPCQPLARAHQSAAPRPCHPEKQHAITCTKQTIKSRPKRPPPTSPYLPNTNNETTLPPAPACRRSSWRVTWFSWRGRSNGPHGRSRHRPAISTRNRHGMAANLEGTHHTNRDQRDCRSHRQGQRAGTIRQGACLHHPAGWRRTPHRQG